MITAFLQSDVAPFLAMATREGWMCDEWEFNFLLQAFPQGCFVWREGKTILGYVTSVRYCTSGWIGNLLVHPDARRRGVGRQLMEAALYALLKEGAETVWLTASEKGAGLYKRLGFYTLDTIHRWTGKGSASQSVRAGRADMDLVRAVDRAGWGDKRDSLLAAASTRGRFHSSSGGFICGQKWESGMQIGPWGCLISSQAAQLLQDALSDAGSCVFLDVPVGNHAAAALLEQHGFTVEGSNLLMYLGIEPCYRPENVYALASMGSMG